MVEHPCKKQLEQVLGVPDNIGDLLEHAQAEMDLTKAGRDRGGEAMDPGTEADPSRLDDQN